MSIHRENKKLLDEYLKNRTSYGFSARTVLNHSSILLKFLGFVGDKSIQSAEQAIKAYKSFLMGSGARSDDTDKMLSQEYVRKNLLTVQAFLAWLREEKGRKFKKFSDKFLNQHLNLLPAERNKLDSLSEVDLDAKKPDFYTLEEIVKFANFEPTTLLEERTQAATLFLWSSEMRVRAFMTLPIRAVNFDEKQVLQHQSFGVQTKANKQGTTHIILPPEYPEIEKRLRAWDSKIRSILPDTCMWFPNISPITGELDSSPSIGDERHSGFRQDLKMLTGKIGIPYRPPHQLRHSAIRYLRDKATNFTALEAIAENGLHSVETMMKYGRLNRATHKATIENLISGATPTIQETNPHFVALFESQLQELSKKMDEIQNFMTGTRK